MTDEHFDVVVVGGGIHGVGVAQAAAAAGFRVLLLEMRSLAHGTSSRSTKLIHGGLRYLENGELGLVRECLRERALLLKLAPDLVTLQPFFLPVYRRTRRRPWQLRIGLSLYALLAQLEKDARFRTVPPAEWTQLDGLSTADLEAIFEYRDAQTDDELLTRAVMSSAEGLGAELAMPARFCAAALTKTGCSIDFEHDGRPRSCFARVLVNAAGPWAPAVLDAVRPAPPRRQIELVQGAHIEVAGALQRGIYYLESPEDGRAVFVIPWRGHTLVGTTETPFEGDPELVRALPEEERYLVAVLQHYFPRREPIGPHDILCSWAGLRVLPAGGKRAFRRTRETIFDVDRRGAPRVLTIYGGKLTAYRATAEKVMQHLAPSLPVRRAIADTRTLELVPP